MRDAVTMSAADLDERDVDAVCRVLRSGRLALGPCAEQFERALADYVGVGHAVAVSSGTAALHAVVRALGLGPGDEVLAPAFTFAATINALLYEGVEPVFVDVEPDTGNLRVEDLERRITPRTRGVMVVDVFGHPAEWGPLTELARDHDLRLIDDACEALGAEYRGARVGRFGDAATFGFYPNKQITTGEGGAVVTDDASLARSVRSLRNQGRDAMGGWLRHERLGFNYRLDEMSAALGLSQLARIDELLERRRRVATWYDERLRGRTKVRVPGSRPHVKRSWFVYVVTLAPEVPRDAIMRRLDEQGIPSRAYFPPVHLQPFMQRRPGATRIELPQTEALARRTLALPFHARLTESDVDRVVGALERAVGRCAGDAPE